MSDKELPCDIKGTGLCSILDDFYSLQDKYHRLENEKSDIERELKDLRKTIANNTVPYPDSYIEYITDVVGNVGTAAKWTMQISVLLCICMSIVCAIAYARSDSIDLIVCGILGTLIVILVISTLGYITIPSKYVFSFMIKDYIAHKKAEKVAEFYRLFPLPKKEVNNDQDMSTNSAKL